MSLQNIHLDISINAYPNGINRYTVAFVLTFISPFTKSE
ncbi:hypothetical protein THOG05_360030 [Vibrio rotiferianus]|nr:hypothetical protein THOG05_360030 [Vibrio rotiferianus]